MGTARSPFRILVEMSPTISRIDRSISAGEIGSSSSSRTSNAYSQSWTEINIIRASQDDRLGRVENPSQEGRGIRHMLNIRSVDFLNQMPWIV